ncbi:MAG: acetyltransferase [Intrasporangium sp.]|uniref:acetyltransferase n=1 Tax=Intrasporangium sp. TaxID=1925024 RepID=UPI0026484FAC|nr:acetyltransferase [Intrasporangium sp.]MDN5794748.1 acetyltransferase [Intrasporangium sp.]
MTPLRAVIIGASGHGRELLGWLRDSAPSTELEFIGFLDDGSPSEACLDRVDAHHLGPLDELANLPDVVHYVGIGDPAMRRTVAQRALLRGSRPGPALVHPRAHVGADITIGDGSILAPGAVLTTSIRLGQHVHVSSNVVIGHDSVVADFVSIYPGATISGNVAIDAGVTIGTNSTVIQERSIGAGSTVGAGAVVVRDVPSGTTVAGVPARER